MITKKILKFATFAEGEEYLESQKGIDTMKESVARTPVSSTSVGVEIHKKISREVKDYDQDGPLCDVPETVCQPTSNHYYDQRTKEELDSVARCLKRDAEKEEKLATAKFSDQIRIDFIPTIDYRILCRFLGVTSVNNIKNHPHQAHPLISLILMETLVPFMAKKGFTFVGELNFDNNGNSIPPVKNPWLIKGKEITFTTTGFLYFEKIDGKKNQNVAFFLFSDLERGATSITCFSTSTVRSKKIVSDLQTYAKEHNCLRGAKLRDVNMISASFSEVEVKPEYNWDNYYYTQEIKDLFDLEIFGFVKNIKKYNKNGIFKRGFILFGKPGSGKTTLGNIICALVPAYTVIWITPEILSENSYKAISSIKALYKLADFLAPCIVILEDLDLFGQDREQGGGDIMSLGALMNVLDGVNSIANSVTIATTNRLHSIETALRNRPGRFDRVIEIKSLTEELRTIMLKERLKEWNMDEETLQFLVGQTKEWTGAEVQEFVNSLNLKHIGSKRKIKKLDKQWTEDIIKMMRKFGVGEASSGFGFTSPQSD